MTTAATVISSTPLAVLNPNDPSELGFPPMLPIELAMRIAPVDEICTAYGISLPDFEQLSESPLFVQAYRNAKDALQKDGMSFKIKAKMQAEALLAKSWAIIHDPSTPSAVKADLIKHTVRWAEYEPRPSAAGPGGLGSAFQININLGG